MQKFSLVNLGKVVSILILVVTISCKSDDDGTTNETQGLLPQETLTQYIGSLVYTPTNGSVIINTNGSATLSNTGGSYTLSFSDDVPSISDLNFLEEGNGDFVSVSTGNSITGITVSNGELSITANISGNTWVFSSN